MNNSTEGYRFLPAAFPFPKEKHRRPIFELSFEDYIATTNGLFNFLEIVGGIVLNVLVGKNSGGGDSKTLRWLSGTGYTFSFNGIFMMVTSLLSSDSAAYLPVLFYVREELSVNSMDRVRVCASAILEGHISPIGVFLSASAQYVLFQATGAASYIVSGLMLARQNHEVSVVVVMGLCSGGMHAFHFAYSCYKNYIEDDSKKWWNKKIVVN
ncbi:hypothetical protein HPB52_020832 [Rhipicephalus sanguineus]|uniref:Uncharacterized protein n=1 Tax=Rhipicephalus sanguineus TaxID=34632 RepID=A0A9D4QBL9_RHISA|nr:hypothetical protein HPB52_020832 [Rhipicephalus sanguineus]